MLERTDAVTPLTDFEARELEDYERIISRGLETFVLVGNALLTIRTQRLYRATHNTFEAYCRERWQMSRPNAYELMDAAVTAKTLMSGTPDIPAPTAVSQMRPLAKLEPEAQRQAWEHAVKESNGHTPTAAKVKEVVRAHVPARAKQKSQTAIMGTKITPLEGLSDRDFLFNLLQEIEQRRKQHDMRIKARGWTPDKLNKLELLDLLDWIEEQLNLRFHRPFSKKSNGDYRPHMDNEAAPRKGIRTEEKLKALAILRLASKLDWPEEKAAVLFQEFPPRLPVSTHAAAELFEVFREALTELGDAGEE